MVASPFQVVVWFVVVSHPSDEERKIVKKCGEGAGSVAQSDGLSALGNQSRLFGPSK